MKHKYPDHHKQLARLNRIGGQFEGVKRMIAARRYCPEILVQLRAIRSALRAVEANILEVHLGSCVVQALASKSAKEKAKKINELKEIFSRFEQ